MELVIGLEALPVQLWGSILPAPCRMRCLTLGNLLCCILPRLQWKVQLALGQFRPAI